MKSVNTIEALREQIVKWKAALGTRPAGVAPDIEGLDVRAAVDVEELLEAVVVLPHAGDHEVTTAFQVLPLRELNLHLRHRRSEERRVGKECRSRWSPYH